MGDVELALYACLGECRLAQTRHIVGKRLLHVGESIDKSAHATVGSVARQTRREIAAGYLVGHFRKVLQWPRIAFYHIAQHYQQPHEPHHKHGEHITRDHTKMIYHLGIGTERSYRPSRARDGSVADKHILAAQSAAVISGQTAQHVASELSHRLAVEGVGIGEYRLVEYHAATGMHDKCAATTHHKRKAVVVRTQMGHILHKLLKRHVGRHHPYHIAIFVEKWQHIAYHHHIAAPVVIVRLRPYALARLFGRLVPFHLEIIIILAAEIHTHRLVAERRGDVRHEVFPLLGIIVRLEADTPSDYKRVRQCPFLHERHQTVGGRECFFHYRLIALHYILHHKQTLVYAVYHLVEHKSGIAAAGLFLALATIGVEYGGYAAECNQNQQCGP